MSNAQFFENAKNVYLNGFEVSKIYQGSTLIYQASILADPIIEVATEDLGGSVTADNYTPGDTEWGVLTLSDGVQVSEDGLEFNNSQIFASAEGETLTYPMTLEWKGRIDSYTSSNAPMLWGMGQTVNSWGQTSVCSYAHNSYGIIVDSGGSTRRIVTYAAPTYAHIIYVINTSGAVTMYLNGATHSWTAQADNGTKANKLYFYNGEGKGRFSGAISLFRWWNRNLTLEEITELFSEDSNLYQFSDEWPEYNETPIYENSNLIFDGTNYIDTQIPLFDTRKDFKIEISFISAPGNSKARLNTILHCMKEVNPYPGINIDTNTNNNIYKCSIGTSNITLPNTLITDPNTEHTIILMAKKSTTASVLEYKLICDNNELSTTNGPYTQIPNTVLLGGYIDNSGNYGRYWNGTITSIKIYYAT